MKEKEIEKYLDTRLKILQRIEEYSAFLILCIVAFTIVLCVKLSKVSDLGTLVEIGLLNIGLTIIAVVVTVWAGLNISNAIDRKDVDEATRKAAELSAEFDRLNKTSLSSGRNLFLQELNHRNTVSAYFFNEKLKEQKLVNTIEAYEDITVIEQLYGRIAQMHINSDNTEELFKDVSKVVDIIKKLNTQESNDQLVIYSWLKTYLSYREAVCHFYRGYGYDEAEPQRAYEDFKYAASLFEKLMYTVNDKKFINKLKGAIGECYSKMAFYRNRKASSINIRDINNINETKNIAEKAITYCEDAIQDASPKDRANEMFYRNLGAAYEHRAYLEQNISKRCEFFQKAIEQYTTAMSKALKDQSTSTKQFCCIYHVLLSGYDRLIRTKLGWENFDSKVWGDEDGNPLPAKIADIGSIALDVEAFLSFAQLAVNDMPRVKLHHSMLGFAYLWRIYLEDNGIDLSDIKVHRKYEMDRRTCRININSELAILEILTENDDYRDDIIKARCFYDKD